MKYVILFFVFAFITISFAYPQQINSVPTNNDVPNLVSGSYPYSTSMLRGGKEKTATGTLKVLVVFVRYNDDLENTPTWPNYNELPSWAQTLVDQNIPANNIFTTLNLSDFFDRASGGNGNGLLGQFHVIGDVKYVSTLYNKGNYTSDGAVINEILSRLDNPTGGYNINFQLYDNWTFMQNGNYFTHSYTPNIGDNIVDQIFFIFRSGSISIPSAGGEKTLGNISTFTANDGAVVQSTSGSRMFNAKQ